MNLTPLIILTVLFTASPIAAFHEKGAKHAKRKVINAPSGSVPLVPLHDHYPSVKRASIAEIEPVFLLRSQETGVSSTEKISEQRANDPTNASSTTPTNAENSSLTSTLPPGSTESISSTGAPSTTEIEPVSSSTTPEPPPTTEIPPVIIGQGESTKAFFCLCDSKVDTCDMNCCCDPDCTEEEKKNLFTGCTGSVIYDPHSKRNKDHSCFKSYVMYRQNVPYRIDRTDKGLFCVVKENMKHVREFSKGDMDRITRKVLNRQLNLQAKYSWEPSTLELPEGAYLTLKEEPYRYGSAIWTVRSTEDSYEEVVLRLPAPFHTSICSIQEPVKFLEESSSSCILPLSRVSDQCESLPELNVNYFIKTYSIIGNPTIKEANASDYLVHGIIPSVACHNDEQCLSFTDSPDDDISFPKPVYDQEQNLCQNVLFRLNLTFVHEGLQGITRIIARTDLVDVPHDSKEIRQEFSVEFIWRKGALVKPQNETGNVTTIVSPPDSELRKLPRSGNPGYLVGKPVILGRKFTTQQSVSNESNEFVNVEKIQVSPDNSHWLQIQGPGNCPEDTSELQAFPRNSILFGFEHVSTCKLRLDSFRRCEQLQSHIAAVIFGEEEAKAFTKASWYVAAYGSPDAFPSDWVPLTFIEISELLGPSSTSSLVSNGCDSIITALHITIAYALVGPEDIPQAKITGVFYEAEDSFPLPADSLQCSVPSEDCEKPIRDLSITTTVSFVDITGQPTTRVATWPVVSIRLPSDFFYPFSSSSPSPSSVAKLGVSNILNFNALFIVAVLFTCETVRAWDA